MREIDSRKPDIISDAIWRDREAACRFLESTRWPDGIPTCPHCRTKGRSFRITAKAGSRTRQGLWKCGHCREQYTVTVATSFERAHVPGKWLHAVYLLCHSGQGMSPGELRQVLHVSHKSATLIAERIQYAMTREPLAARLGSRRSHARALFSRRIGHLSLRPLSFQDAVAALLQIRPENRQDSPAAMDRQDRMLRGN